VADSTDPVSDTTVERARALDATDPLAAFRDRFAMPDPSLVYLDGNSLGRPPIEALEAVANAGRKWSEALIRGWTDEAWLEYPLRVGERLATGVLGAAAGEVAVTDSTTVNLYRLAVAALEARRPRRIVVIERSEFPTDRYVVEGLARERDLEIRWIEGDPVEGLFHGSGEVVVDQVAEMLLEQPGHGECQPRRDQGRATFVDVAAVLDRADG